CLLTWISFSQICRFKNILLCVLILRKALVFMVRYSRPTIAYNFTQGYNQAEEHFLICRDILTKALETVFVCVLQAIKSYFRISVICVPPVDLQVKSLAQVAPFYKGDNGDSGGSKNCYGRNASTTYIAVPVGTVVKELGKTVSDLSQHNQEYVAVFGGAGGKGNRFFLSNENRAPMTATLGERGQERVLQLELRTMAHAGLVGFPNAGKSSLLRAISNARPAVAAYPFTTLNPHVGIVNYRDHEQVAVADIPGIICGAHLNRGLGISFLRHIERCRFLLFVLDLSSPEPWTQLQQLRYELDQYEPGLTHRPHAIVANKMDLPGARGNLEALRGHVAHRVIPVSALTGQNTEELILHLRELYDGYLQTHGQGSGQDMPTRW
ncbi:unnamed protein product, partial [Oncorhynchus mykiss]